MQGARTVAAASPVRCRGLGLKAQPLQQRAQPAQQGQNGFQKIGWGRVGTCKHGGAIVQCPQFPRSGKRL